MRHKQNRSQRSIRISTTELTTKRLCPQYPPPPQPRKPVIPTKKSATLCSRIRSDTEEGFACDVTKAVSVYGYGYGYSGNACSTDIEYSLIYFWHGFCLGQSCYRVSSDPSMGFATIRLGPTD